MKLLRNFIRVLILKGYWGNLFLWKKGEKCVIIGADLGGNCMKYAVHIMFKEEDIFDAEVMGSSIRIDISVNHLDKIEDILDINNIRNKCLSKLKWCKQFEKIWVKGLTLGG